MFGEKSIYGQTEVTVDKKGRIALPRITYSEEGDELIALKSDNEKLKIISVSSLDETINKIENMILEELDKEKVKALEDKLYGIYSSIYRKCVCDNSKRINLSGIVEKEKTYRVIGCKDSIVLEKKLILKEEN